MTPPLHFWLAFMKDGVPASNQGEAVPVAAEARGQIVAVTFRAVVKPTGPANYCAIGIGDCLIAINPVQLEIRQTDDVRVTLTAIYEFGSSANRMERL